MIASIIILTYNSSKYIEHLLESLQRYNPEIKEKKLGIIIADNGSKDDTVEKAKKFKFAKVIENEGNFGFAKGNNLAAKKANGEFLIFLNPDTKFVSGDIFDLLKEFENPKVGIVGGEILNFKGEREFSAGKTYTLPRVLLLSLGLEERVGVRFSPNKRQEVDHVTGAFLAIRADLFEKLNGFDEHYFMYIEDSDLCFRAKKLGYKVIFSTSATIQHLGQGSSNRKFAVVNIYKGLLYFHKKRMSKLSYFGVLSALRTKAILLVILGKISHNQYLADTYAEALKATR